MGGNNLFTLQNLNLFSLSTSVCLNAASALCPLSHSKSIHELKKALYCVSISLLQKKKDPARSPLALLLFVSTLSLSLSMKIFVSLS